MAGGFRSPLWPLGISSDVSPASLEVEATLLTIPTSWRQLGLSVLYGDSLCVTNRNTALGNIGEEIESYTHEIRATGGFYSCSVTLKANPGKLRDWLEHGVGRHIEVYDQGGTVVWEGFVDRVTAAIENVQITQGPLISSDVGNRVKIRYPVVDYSISPPVVGVTLLSAATDNTASQSRFGVIERVLGGGEITETMALQIRNSWLREHAFPQSSITSSYSQSNEPSLTIECLGYWHYLNTWTYRVSAASDQSVTSKIQDVLESSPNDIFSTDYSYFDTNLSLVKQEETDDKTAGSVISDLATLSDSSNNKYIAGFMADRVFYYQTIPEEINYYQETGSVILDKARNRILPWSVKPGKWIYYSGLLPDSTYPDSLDELYQNPVTGFIETVTFNSPFDVAITTQRLSKLDQLFTRLGITGI